MAKATQNAINDWALTSTGIGLSTSGGTSDIGIQFQNSGSSKFYVGIQNSSGSFKMSQGTAFGTNDTFILDNTGAILKPLNSAAAYKQTASLSNVTGNGAVFTLGTTTALTKIIDQNNNMTTAGIFTAPATGKYLFSYTFSYQPNNASGSTQTLHKVVTTNRTYTVKNFPTRRRFSNFFGPNGWLAMSASLVANMTAGDTASFTYTGSGGSANSDLSKTVDEIGATLIS